MAGKKRKNSDYRVGKEMPQNPSFSMKDFLKSTDTVAALGLWAASFVVLFISYKFVSNTTVRLVLSFIAVSMTFSSTDQLVELYNWRRFGIKPQKKQGLFGQMKGMDQNDTRDSK